MRHYIYDEIVNKLEFVSSLSTCLILIAMTVMAKNLAGRSWLAVGIALLFFPNLMISALEMRVSGLADHIDIEELGDVIGMLPFFGSACVGVFFLANRIQPYANMQISRVLFAFDGRVPRHVFWMAIAILSPLGLFLNVVPFELGRSIWISGWNAVGIWCIYFFYAVVSLWISLAVFTKRWHDCGRPGWMNLVLLLPIVGPLWLIGYCGFVRGTEGPNQFGNDPLDADD